MFQNILKEDRGDDFLGYAVCHNYLTLPWWHESRWVISKQVALFQQNYLQGQVGGQSELKATVQAL